MGNSDYHRHLVEQHLFQDVTVVTGACKPNAATVPLIPNTFFHPFSRPVSGRELSCKPQATGGFAGGLLV